VERTFLFTDIEASTRHWEHDQEAMSAALERHDAIVRSVVEGCGGVMVKHTGDGVLAVFEVPGEALRAAVAIQRGLGTGDVRVRAGLHTGTAEERDGDYFGPTLNRTARIMGLGRGGHVLLSAATNAAIGGDLLESVLLLDLGEHPLDGFERPERIHQAIGDGLTTDRALDERHPTSTFGTRTSFVGRQAELESISRLLDTERCVTLTGVGGCGKTRLALEVARQRAPGWADGACIVELAALADPGEVPRAVADAIGMPVVAGSIGRDLTVFLRDRECLLVLDNCEHLLEACADLVDNLVDSCLGVTVLATSREPLGLDGERAWRAPSLTLPSGDDADELDCEAAALFIARAEAVRSTFIAPMHRDAIVAICRGLDGLPLAIELAAARTDVLSPEQIAEMLDDRFRLLTGGARRSRQRQQTLRAAMDWSHDLLTDAERCLLRRLAVFGGGCTLEAAIATCGDGDPLAIIDGLGSLVGKSLVIADETAHGMRYRMLETVRLYAQDRLFEAGEATARRDRHLAWLLEHLAAIRREHGDRWVEPGAGAIAVELENLRLAFDWSEEQDRGDLVVRLVILTWPLWYLSARGHEALAWLDRHADAVDGTLTPTEQVEWRVARGFLLQESMDGAAQARCGEEVLALDPDGSLSDLTGLAWLFRMMLPVFVDPSQAVRIATEALEWVDRYGSPVTADVVAGYAANAFISDGRWEEARGMLADLAAQDQIDAHLEAWVEAGFATVLLLLGDVAGAGTRARSLAAAVTPTIGRHVESWAHAFLAIVEAAQGDVVASRRALEASVTVVRRRYAHIDSAWGIPITAAAVILAIEGRDADAMRLFFAVGAHGRVWQARQEMTFVLHREHSRAVADRLGPDATVEAWVAGEAMTVAEMHAAVDALVVEAFAV